MKPICSVSGLKTSLLLYMRFFEQGSASTLFYTGARRKIWVQAFAMCGVGSEAVAAILFKRLTTIGGGTPIISWNLQV